ncbi:MAG: hypothetical protein DRH08_01810 [Deltaproteobacteria bacterium]|nr:MAG: hypothetical protein DRH08_01810 [Deltaproteobacteria bacterium]
MKLIGKRSPFTGKYNEMSLDITKEEETAYAQGALLQVAFPRLNPEEREFYKTGIMPDEWPKEPVEEPEVESDTDMEGDAVEDEPEEETEES